MPETSSWPCRRLTWAHTVRPSNYRDHPCQIAPGGGHIADDEHIMSETSDLLGAALVKSVAAGVSSRTSRRFWTSGNEPSLDDQ